MRLPDGALKLQLLGDIAELVQLSPRELSDLWMPGAAPAAAAARNPERPEDGEGYRPRSGGMPAARRVAGSGRVWPASRADHAARLLLATPLWDTSPARTTPAGRAARAARPAVRLAGEPAARTRPPALGGAARRPARSRRRGPGLKLWPLPTWPATGRRPGGAGGAAPPAAPDAGRRLKPGKRGAGRWPPIRRLNSVTGNCRRAARRFAPQP
jgi:hypothetical protein